MPAKSKVLNETQFDQRLFGQAQGLNQGYGDDEAYNVYDKPWREGGSMANHIYRPSRNIDKDNYGGEELEKAIRTNRLAFYIYYISQLIISKRLLDLFINNIDAYLYELLYKHPFSDLFQIKNLEELIVLQLLAGRGQFNLKKILLGWINSCLKLRKLVKGKNLRKGMTEIREREEIKFLSILSSQY